MIAPEMPSEPGTTSTSTIDIVPVQEAFSLFTRRSPTTDHPRIQAKAAATFDVPSVPVRWTAACEYRRQTPTASYQASCQAGEFLVDDRGVELGEHQGRLGDRRTDRDWCTASRTHPGVVTGDHRVGTAAVVEVTDLLDPGHRLQVAGPAVHPVNRVRRVREEGREDRVQVDDALREHVQHRPEPLALVLACESPRRG